MEKRAKTKKQQDCEDAEIYEVTFKQYYKDNVENPTFKIISPKDILTPFWSPSFDRREGDLWMCYDTPGNLHVVRRLDIKHNGWVGIASIHDFGDDEDHWYAIWNDNGSQSYIIPAIAVRNLLQSFESDENSKSKWIVQMPVSHDPGINLNDFGRRYALRTKIALDKDIENINERKL